MIFFPRREWSKDLLLTIRGRAISFVIRLDDIRWTRTTRDYYEITIYIFQARSHGPGYYEGITIYVRDARLPLTIG